MYQVVIFSLVAFVTTLVGVRADDGLPKMIGWYFIQNNFDSIDRLDVKRATHVFFADRYLKFEDCDINRRYRGSSPLSGEEFEVPRIRKLRDQYGFKMILMLGGWAGSDNFAYCSRPERLEKTVKNIVDYLEKYGFDGVDVDWEHVGLGGIYDFEKWLGTKEDNYTLHQGTWQSPERTKEMLDGGWQPHYADSWKLYLNLLKRIRVEYKKRGKEQMQILSAMSIGGQAEGCQGRIEGTVYEKDEKIFHYVPCEYPDWGAICEELDFLSVMVYDVWGPWYPKTGHHAPFSCDPKSNALMNVLSPPYKNPCEPRFTVRNAVQWYKNPKEPEGGHVHKTRCPIHKISIGMPLYGKEMCKTSGLYQNGEGCNRDSFKRYSEIGGLGYRSIINHPYFFEHPEYFQNATNAEGELVGSYYYNPNDKYFVTFDSKEIVYEKTKYLAQEGTAGYFFWAAEMDFNHEIGKNALNGWRAGRGLGPMSDDELSVYQRKSKDSSAVWRYGGASMSVVLSTIIVMGYLQW